MNSNIICNHRMVFEVKQKQILENFMRKTAIPKFSNPNNTIDKKKLTMCLTFKVVIPHIYTPLLNSLYDKAKECSKRMLEDRTKSSSKYYPEIPCVIAKSLITKYQRNKKLKNITNLVLPICGDKGKQVKIAKKGIKVPSIFKKNIIPVTFPKPITGFIRQVEFFKRNKQWMMSYSYNTPIMPQINTNNYIGVDRNSVGNVVTIADCKTGKVRKIGQDVASITRVFRNRRTKLQKKGVKELLKKLKRKQKRRVTHINHRVSKTVVEYAKLHCSALVLEDLGSISKKGKAKRYVQKSQWSFYQLETFIKYKAALLGIPIYYVSAKYTSRMCSKCGILNIPNGKSYKCLCGHEDHRDANAAFNISAKAYIFYGRALADRVVSVGLIDNPPNQRSEKAFQLESSGGAR